MSNKLNMIAGLYRTFAFEQLPVNGVTRLTVATFTESSGAVAKRAIITIEDAQIRYRMDGTDPTATVGHLLNPGDILTIIGNGNMSDFRAINTSAVGEMNISYEN